MKMWLDKEMLDKSNYRIKLMPKLLTIREHMGGLTRRRLALKGTGDEVMNPTRATWSWAAADPSAEHKLRGVAKALKVERLLTW